MKWKPPVQTPLDVFGIDDAGVYFPPSRVRYEEWSARTAKLEARVAKLEASMRNAIEVLSPACNDPDVAIHLLKVALADAAPKDGVT